MNENMMLRLGCALSAPKKPLPEIVFCGECADLAFGRVDGTPLCLACMLARLGRTEERPGAPC